MTLTPLDPADLAAAEALYLASFPPEERRDWQQIADPATAADYLLLQDLCAQAEEKRDALSKAEDRWLELSEE